MKEMYQSRRCLSYQLEGFRSIYSVIISDKNYIRTSVADSERDAVRPLSSDHERFDHVLIIDENRRKEWASAFSR